MKTAHLNPLRALEAILRLCGFREAASELGVTPAAVGQQIRELENYLGRALFDRLPGGAMWPSAAVAVGDRLTASFQDLGEVLGALRANGPSSRVAVTMTTAIDKGW